MQPRPALPEDAEDIASIHSAAWHETYPGLLPAEVIDQVSDPDRRLRQWQKLLARTDLRVSLIPGTGFACMGTQRDPVLAAQGYPEELSALYVLQSGQGKGLGAALFRSVQAEPPLPFSILVLADNLRALSFYRWMGAVLLEERPEHIGDAPIREAVLGWTPTTALAGPATLR